MKTFIFYESFAVLKPKTQAFRARVAISLFDEHLIPPGNEDSSMIRMAENEDSSIEKMKILLSEHMIPPNYQSFSIRMTAEIRGKFRSFLLENQGQVPAWKSRRRFLRVFSQDPAVAAGDGLRTLERP